MQPHAAPPAVPDYREIADRLHEFGSLGMVYLRARLACTNEQDRRALDVLALAAVNGLGPHLAATARQASSGG